MPKTMPTLISDQIQRFQNAFNAFPSHTRGLGKLKDEVATSLEILGKELHENGKISFAPKWGSIRRTIG